LPVSWLGKKIESYQSDYKKIEILRAEYEDSIHKVILLNHQRSRQRLSQPF